MTIKPADCTAAHVVAFCEVIAPGSKPQCVQCLPLPGKPFNECVAIVPEHAAAQGGGQLTGWAVWEVAGLFIEAEFHAVWQRPDGVLVCLTPRPQPVQSITFLADAKRQYEGRQIDNIRQPLVRDDDLVRFLWLHARRFEMLNQGDFADQNSAVTLVGEAAREMTALEHEVAYLQQRLAMRYPARPD